MTQPTYDQLVAAALFAGETVGEMITDLEDMTPIEQTFVLATAELVLRGGQIFATLAQAQATRDAGEPPARPKLRGIG